MAKFRTEDIIPFKKEAKKKEVVRQFKKETSVFSKWIPDNKVLLEKCFEQDTKLWKMHRFVKDEEEQDEIKRVLFKNYALLKDTFLYVAAISHFPAITSNEVTWFAKHSNIMDKNLT